MLKIKKVYLSRIQFSKKSIRGSGSGKNGTRPATLLLSNFKALFFFSFYRQLQHFYEVSENKQPLFKDPLYATVGGKVGVFASLRFRGVTNKFTFNAFPNGCLGIKKTTRRTQLIISIIEVTKLNRNGEVVYLIVFHLYCLLFIIIVYCRPNIYIIQ